mmetsp:Transcript_10080/g.8876  ORF Transcript_10080/g.8876 Transcript_10080/m.8876 type:complete len:111 (+) Transcript_10080:38-370(+)
MAAANVEEFKAQIQAFLANEEGLDQMAAQMFAKHDDDNSGQIDKNEIGGMFRDYVETGLIVRNPDLPADNAELCQNYIAANDADGDGQLDLAEFKVLFKNLQKFIYAAYI